MDAPNNRQRQLLAIKGEKRPCTQLCTSSRKAVIRCPECAVGMCTVFQSQRQRQQIQMHHHHIPIHNPVQVRQSSAHKFRYAKKYRFHRFLKIKVTLTLRPHPLWVVENSVLLLGPLSSQNRMRIPAFKWPQKTE